MEKKLYNKIFICFILLFISVLLNGILVVRLILSDKDEIDTDSSISISDMNIEESDILKKLEKINLERVNNLMIVAHPDDEILWGGGHLIEDDYLVVCVTCGTREKRLVEFSEVMYQTRDSYISLSYPDRTNNNIDSWDAFESAIIRDLSEIINYKEWNLIVTHNPDGEYGHIHHKLLNRYVTGLIKNNNLYYFGKYYTSEEIYLIDTSEWFRLSDATYKRKETVENYYPSQSGAIAMYKHIDMYENWIKATEWENDLSM
ncbi:MAG: PIG-L family deacetylase [Bacilli bacterium]|nr:PIG-L family deacetylase [Bacilli bacterium]